MDRTYKVEVMTVYETTGGKEERIHQAAVYENLSYENLVELQTALTPPVSAVLLGLGKQGVEKKAKKAK